MLLPEWSYTDAFCTLPFSHVKINTAGDVTMCCYQGGPIGNVLTTPMEDVWKSDLAREIRGVTQEQKLHRCCTTWQGCPFQNVKIERGDRTRYSLVGPTSVELDLPSTHCNIGGIEPSDERPACVMCPRNSVEFRSDPAFKLDNTDQILKAIRPIMPHINQLSVLGVAEPFWKNLIFEVLDKLDFAEHKSHIHFWTISNGTVFSEAAARRFMDSVGSSTLIFSVDAGTKETFVKIRRLDFFETIRRNIKRYNEIKIGKRKTELFNNINTLNAHEMTLMVEFAKDVGVNRLRFNPTHNCGIDKHAGDIMVNKGNLSLFVDHYAKAKERAQALDLDLSLVRQFEQCVVSRD